MIDAVREMNHFQITDQQVTSLLLPSPHHALTLTSLTRHAPTCMLLATPQHAHTLLPLSTPRHAPTLPPLTTPRHALTLTPLATPQPHSSSHHHTTPSLHTGDGLTGPRAAHRTAATLRQDLPHPVSGGEPQPRRDPVHPPLPRPPRHRGVSLPTPPVSRLTSTPVSELNESVVLKTKHGVVV